MEKTHIKDAVVYLADAFTLMPTLGEVDAIISDPPYNSRTHQGARSARSIKESPIDFESLSERQFTEFCANCVTQAKRWVVMSCAWQHAALLEKAGVPLVRLGIWHKPNGAPQFTGDRPGMGWEAIAILHREGRKHWNGGGHHAVWVCNVERGEHPTQKPLRLVMDWIANSPTRAKRCSIRSWARARPGWPATNLAANSSASKSGRITSRWPANGMVDVSRQGELFAPTGS
jgi:hypothetical protein